LKKLLTERKNPERKGRRQVRYRGPSGKVGCKKEGSEHFFNTKKGGKGERDTGKKTLRRGGVGL